MPKKNKLEDVTAYILEKHGVELEYLVCKDIPDAYSHDAQTVASHSLGLHNACVIVTSIEDYKGRFVEGGGTKILKGIANKYSGIPVYVFNAIDSAQCNDKAFDTILKNAGYELDKDMTEAINDDGTLIYSKLVEEGEEDE